MLKIDCEYFCTNCYQLRLSYLKKTKKCKNCKSKAIIKGKQGSLNKDQLKKQYQFINLLDKTDPYRTKINKDGYYKKKSNIT